MKKKKIRAILIVLLAVVFLCCGTMVIRQQLEYHRINADQKEAMELAGLEPDKESGYTAEVRPSQPAQEDAGHLEEIEVPDEVRALAEINIRALKAVNRDVVGWIEIPGTTLSYPLVRGGNNDYYLTRNWKGENSTGGAIFLETMSDPDLSGFQTIIYGHRMRNESMFGVLKHYSDEDYWREHPAVYIVKDGKIREYGIFSAQEASVRGIVYRLDKEDDNDLQEEYIRYCASNSVIYTGILPKSDNQFLTLSTCTGNGYSSRWVVHGVLVEEYDIG